MPATASWLRPLAVVAMVSVVLTGRAESGGPASLRDHVGPGSSLSAEQELLVADGLEMFEAAGLTLPRVDFVFHDDTSECSMRRGLYHLSSHTVEMCTMNPETLVHELAHAWGESNLTDVVKATFMQHRGLTVWNDKALAWEERGIEQAAAVVTWGVGSGPDLIRWVEDDGVVVHRLLIIPDSTAPELAEAYQMLTGRPVDPARLAEDVSIATAFSSGAQRAR